MTSSQEVKAANEVGVELKYCEHCGGLYVRQRGADVYCPRCQSKVADLPAVTPKKTRIVLPVRSITAIEEYKCAVVVESSCAFKAAGGAA